MEMGLPFTPETAASGGVVMALLFWLWREVRKARNEDKRDDAESKLRHDLMAINQAINEQLEQAKNRADKFAEERNREREQRILAEAEIDRLKAHIVEVAGRCSNNRHCGVRVEAVRTS